jgi:hypothetical protein
MINQIIRGVYQELGLLLFVSRLESRLTTFAPALNPVERFVRFKYCLDGLYRKNFGQQSKLSFYVDFRARPQQRRVLDPVAYSGIFLRANDHELNAEPALVDPRMMVGASWRVYELPNLATLADLNRRPTGVGNFCGVVRIGPTDLHVVLEGKNRIRWFQIYRKDVQCRSAQLVFRQLVLARDMLGHWYLKNRSGHYEAIPFPHVFLPIIRSMPFRTRKMRLLRIGIVPRLIAYTNMFSGLCRE